MVRRSVHVWLVFGCLGATLCGTVAWLSVRLIRMDEADVAAVEAGRREESIRLALWRMDSRLSLLLLSGLTELTIPAASPLAPFVQFNGVGRDDQWDFATPGAQAAPPPQVLGALAVALERWVDEPVEPASPDPAPELAGMALESALLGGPEPAEDSRSGSLDADSPAAESGLAAGEAFAAALELTPLAVEPTLAPQQQEADEAPAARASSAGGVRSEPATAGGPGRSAGKAASPGVGLRETAPADSLAPADGSTVESLPAGAAAQSFDSARSVSPGSASQPAASPRPPAARFDAMPAAKEHRQADAPSVDRAGPLPPAEPRASAQRAFQSDEPAPADRRDRLDRVRQQIAQAQQVEPFGTYAAQGGAQAPAGQLRREAAASDPQMRNRPVADNRFAGLVDEQARRNLDDTAGRFLNWSELNSQPDRKASVGVSGVVGAGARLGAIRPVWYEGQLYVLRRVRAMSGQEWVQAVALDFSGLRESLLSDVGDLLPDARLEPLLTESGAPYTRRLATLPIVLIPGAFPALAVQGAGALWMSLVVVWLLALLSLGAVAWVLAAALRLAERRATFVSAVTHELRTPLTSLQLYSDMLATQEDLPEPRRRRYVEVLGEQARRLNHLVANVLSFSGLERGSRRPTARRTDTAALLQSLLPRLQERADVAGMTVCLDVPESAVWAMADDDGVERILSNLVDNAVKYAGRAEDKRIEIHLRPSGRWVHIHLHDHGPGIAPDLRPRLFRPFHRSAEQAAGGAPGVGLGLALCRRLAVAMGGRLDLAGGSDPGASFLLRLRAA